MVGSGRGSGARRPSGISDIYLDRRNRGGKGRHRPPRTERGPSLGTTSFRLQQYMQTIAPPATDETKSTTKFIPALCTSLAAPRVEEPPPPHMFVFVNKLLIASNKPTTCSVKRQTHPFFVVVTAHAYCCTILRSTDHTYH